MVAVASPVVKLLPVMVPAAVGWGDIATGCEPLPVCCGAGAAGAAGAGAGYVCTVG